MTAAARAAGVDKTTAYAARRRDAGFAADWAAARAEARRRFAAGETPRLADDEVVRAAKNGRSCVVRAGPGRWSAAKEEVFLATLAATANICKSAAAAGVSATAVGYRRRRYPDFAARWREALGCGWHNVEALLLENAVAALQRPGAAAEPGGFVTAMSVDQAITVWRLHKAEVTGEGRRPRHDWRRRPASLEEIQAEVLRRVRAIGGTPKDRRDPTAFPANR